MQCLNKANVSNGISFFMMIVGGLLLKLKIEFFTVKVIFAGGLFGFAGGITNWLAVKMLFDTVPGLYGSGVIPRQFQMIRQAMKDMIMDVFFDEQYMTEYMVSRSKQVLNTMDFKVMVENALNGEAMDGMLLEKLTKLADTQEGLMLKSIAGMFGGFEHMVPMLKPLIVAFVGEMANTMASKVDVRDVVSMKTILYELDRVMTTKMVVITPAMVKTILERVIREHLGWLVVWGNVFGAMIGVISLLLAYVV